VFRVVSGGLRRCIIDFQAFCGLEDLGHRQRCRKISIPAHLTAVPDAQILTTLPLSLYGQHTSSRLPTSRVSNGGASFCCAASTLSEMPAASRRLRSASAFASRLDTLKRLVRRRLQCQRILICRAQLLQHTSSELQWRCLGWQALQAAEPSLVRQDVVHMSMRVSFSIVCFRSSA